MLRIFDVRLCSALVCGLKVVSVSDLQHYPFLLTKAAAALAHFSQCICPSVCLSVTRVDQSKTVQVRITKSSPSAVWKTLILGTVKLFHKFEAGHPKRGC